MKLKLLIRGQQTLSFNFLEQLTFTSGIKTFTETISAKYEITNLTHNSTSVCLHFEITCHRGKEKSWFRNLYDMIWRVTLCAWAVWAIFRFSNAIFLMKTYPRFTPLQYVIFNSFPKNIDNVFVMSLKNRKHCANNIAYDALLDPLSIFSKKKRNLALNLGWLSVFGRISVSGVASYSKAWHYVPKQAMLLSSN